MKHLLLAPLLLGLIPSANAGVYYYLDYLDKGSIKVKCAEDKPNHIVEIKVGRTIELKGHGKRKYKNPEMSMEFPYGRWGNAENKMCVYRFLKAEEQKDIIDKALARCGKNKKYCKGMN